MKLQKKSLPIQKERIFLIAYNQMAELVTLQLTFIFNGKEEKYLFRFFELTKY